jgi:poly(3-hydroxybutyrate) depolymerase
MKPTRSAPSIFCAILVLLAFTWVDAAVPPASKLSSGEYFITQSWSQEKDFARPYHVKVPGNPDTRKLPVFIHLHGNGGDAQSAMRGFVKQYPTMASRYILVFPNGYLKSWNISAERSQADDRSFIEAIVERLSTYENVEPDAFTIMGVSNGAALANQLAIECRSPRIRNYVTAVSPLNALQHDGTNFKAKGEDNRYHVVVTPRTGIRLMNISGTEDRLVPYHGGPPPGIPAQNGKLGFVDAEESVFLWAKAMGYQGEKKKNPSAVVGKLELFVYLDGAVIHYKVIGEGHGAVNAIPEETLLRFLEGDGQTKHAQ